MKKVLISAQANATLIPQGINMVLRARENGFGYSLTQEILAGKKKRLRDTSRTIALKLRMNE